MAAGAARRSSQRPAPCPTSSSHRSSRSPCGYILHAPEILAPITQSDLGFFALEVALAFLTINILLFIFNLIPIPPLDGWAVLLGLVPAPLAYQLREFQNRYAAIIPVIFIAFVFIGGARIISPILNTIQGFLLGI